MIEQIIPSLVFIRVYSDDLSFTPWRSADSISLYPRARIDWRVQVAWIIILCSFCVRSKHTCLCSCDCSHNMSRIFLHSTKRAREFFSKVFFVLSDYSLYTVKTFWLSICKLFLLHDFFLRCRSNWRNWLSFFLFSLWLISLFWSWFFYWAWLLCSNHKPERNWVCASSLSALRDLLSSWSSHCLSVRFFFFSSMLSYSAEFEEICESKLLIESIAHWKPFRLFWVSLSSQAITRKPEIRTKMIIDSAIVKMFFVLSFICYY